MKSKVHPITHPPGLRHCLTMRNCFSTKTSFRAWETRTWRMKMKTRRMRTAQSNLPRAVLRTPVQPRRKAPRTLRMQRNRSLCRLTLMMKSPTKPRTRGKAMASLVSYCSLIVLSSSIVLKRAGSLTVFRFRYRYHYCGSYGTSTANGLR